MTETKQKTTTRGKKQDVSCLMVWATAFTICWVIGALYVLGVMDHPDGLNEWGDYVAGASAPLAFLWLVVAVLIQSRELSEQRQEIAENRAVMEEQKSFIAAQTAIMQETRSAAVRDQAFRDIVASLASFLRRYSNGWKFYDRPVHEAPDINPVIDNRLVMSDLTDELLIGRVAQKMRTELRAHRRSEFKDVRLYARFRYDLARLIVSIEMADAALKALEGIDQHKLRALELETLMGVVRYLKGQTDNLPELSNIEEFPEPSTPVPAIGVFPSDE